ncbi:MAG: hypothetical protein Q7T36_13735 [Fluviicoccus sp.]|uniref:hypothetical protein n=1 Tax=Fluviicoccus sp. TaxID=2003552 RepID=UPI002727F1CD|nr:hypothetical protein [Fluviicoccus sp.]MDO8331521.1 hypothetical protein [Fluviicoccus sp.]
MSAADRIANAEAALLELMMFFIRHSLPGWPAKLSTVLELLRERKIHEALDEWARFPLMGEYGLMQVEVTYEYGYRAGDYAAEQAHFQRLLDQYLLTMNNLRQYLRSGVSRPLVEIYLDR